MWKSQLLAYMMFVQAMNFGINRTTGCMFRHSKMLSTQSRRFLLACFLHNGYLVQMETAKIIVTHS